VCVACSGDSRFPDCLDCEMNRYGDSRGARSGVPLRWDRSVDDAVRQRLPVYEFEDECACAITLFKARESPPCEDE
jgi:hypothetical protein